jgi:RNA polymerase sigma-70 factor (ECF subfamily)
MNSDNELELMARVRSGDTEAFRPIAEEYHNRIATYFVRCGLPPDVVKDLTQSTMLRAFDHGCRYSLRKADDRSVESLLFLVARWVKRDHARRDAVRNETQAQYARIAPTRAKVADADLKSEETERVVREAVALLPPRLRLLVELRYLEELPLADVAQRTGMSPNTIKQHLRRARAMLFTILEPWWKGVRNDEF